MTDETFGGMVVKVILSVALCGCILGIGYYSRSVIIRTNQESSKVEYYKTHVRCFNCCSMGVYCGGTVEVQLPMGQSIVDPKSVCPKCKVSFSVGR